MTLNITTKLAKTEKMLLDGEEFELLSMEHLSPEDEAEVVALLSKHTQLGDQLAREPNVERGAAIAVKQKACRVTVLAKLTTIPREALKALPSGAQVQILNALEEIISGDNDNLEGKKDSPGGAADEDL